jgi:hypothetical protein
MRAFKLDRRDGYEVLLDLSEPQATYRTDAFVGIGRKDHCDGRSVVISKHGHDMIVMGRGSSGPGWVARRRMHKVEVIGVRVDDHGNNCGRASGKIQYVTGHFGAGGGSNSSHARENSSLVVDSTFGPGGCIVKEGSVRKGSGHGEGSSAVVARV